MIFRYEEVEDNNHENNDSNDREKDSLATTEFIDLLRELRCVHRWGIG